MEVTRMENNEKKEALERVKKAVKNVVTVIVSCAVFLVVLPLLCALEGVWLACPTAQTITFVIALAAKRGTDKSVD